MYEMAVEVTSTDETDPEVEKELIHINLVVEDPAATLSEALILLLTPIFSLLKQK